MLQNFFESEENYVRALNVVLHYSKALTAALTSSQPVISKDEIAGIFFHIPQLHNHHSDFLQRIKNIKLEDSNLHQVHHQITSAVLLRVVIILFILIDCSVAEAILRNCTPRVWSIPVKF